MGRRIATRISGGSIPASIGGPSLSGTLTVGQVLTCSPGHFVGLHPLTYSYQWMRDAATNIGTNSPNYTLVAGDSTHTVKCQVTATNVLGSKTAVSPSTTVIP